jgi:glyoxylase-like metal-dependent hydrolase (beta-lactamase superfamily II)
MLEGLRLLAAGYCRHPEAMTRRGADWRPQRFPAGFALLERGRAGAALFDTGYGEHFLAETRALPGSLYKRLIPPTIEERDPACRQLAALGVAAADVRAVVVSHFHGDHVAGLRDFPAAEIVCSRAAWDSVRRLRGLGAVRRGFLPGLLPSDVEQRLRFVDDRPAVPLPTAMRRLGVGRDVFGDGAAFAIALPGHAAGQIGLLAHTSHGLALLAADAAWSLEAVETNTPPPRITTAFLGRTREYRATLATLHALHRDHPDVRIVPSHCPRALGLASA